MHARARTLSVASVHDVQVPAVHPQASSSPCGMPARQARCDAAEALGPRFWYGSGPCQRTGTHGTVRIPSTNVVGGAVGIHYGTRLVLWPTELGLEIIAGRSNIRRLPNLTIIHHNRLCFVTLSFNDSRTLCECAGATERLECNTDSIDWSMKAIYLTAKPLSIHH